MDNRLLSSENWVDPITLEEGPYGALVGNEVAVHFARLDRYLAICGFFCTCMCGCSGVRPWTCEAKTNRPENPGSHAKLGIVFELVFFHVFRR